MPSKEPALIQTTHTDQDPPGPFRAFTSYRFYFALLIANAITLSIERFLKLVLQEPSGVASLLLALAAGTIIALAIEWRRLLHEAWHSLADLRAPTEVLDSVNRELSTSLGDLRRTIENIDLKSILINDSPFTGVVGSLYAGASDPALGRIESLSKEEYLYKYLVPSIRAMKSSYFTIHQADLSWFDQNEQFLLAFRDVNMAAVRCVRVFLFASEEDRLAFVADSERLARYWHLVGREFETYYAIMTELSQELVGKTDADITNLESSDIVVCDGQLVFTYRHGTPNGTLQFKHNPVPGEFPYEYVFDNLTGSLSHVIRPFDPPPGEVDLSLAGIPASKVLRIDLGAIRQNCVRISTEVGHGQILGVLKCDAYGMGLLEVAECLLRNDIQWIGVDTIVEAIKLRQRFPEASVVLLEGARSDDCLHIAKYDIQPFIWDDWGPLHALSQSAARYNTTVKVHVKINTGMNRLGVHWIKAPDFVEQLSEKLPTIDIVGIASHMSEGHSPFAESTREHKGRFADAVKKIEAILNRRVFKHMGNSCSMLVEDEPLKAWDDKSLVRVGGAIFGIVHPRPPSTSVKHKEQMLTECVQLVGSVAKVNTLKAGDSLGYGDYRVAEDCRVAVINVGYGDGIPWGSRPEKQDRNVIIQGQRCRIIGGICMGMMFARVDHIESVTVGEAVIMVGKSDSGQQISLRSLAETLDVHPYELMTRMGSSMRRHYDGVRTGNREHAA